MRARSHGFTLIEVLIGIAVLGIAAVVLGAAYVNTLSAHAAVAQRATDGSFLDNLNEVVLNEPDRTKVEAGGDIPLPDNRRLRWQATIEEAPVPDLFRVVVKGEVLGDATKATEEFTQTLMLLRPTWSDPQRREQLSTDWREGRTKEMKR